MNYLIGLSSFNCKVATSLKALEIYYYISYIFFFLNTYTYFASEIISLVSELNIKCIHLTVMSDYTY